MGSDLSGLHTGSTVALTRDGIIVASEAVGSLVSGDFAEGVFYVNEGLDGRSLTWTITADVYELEDESNEFNNVDSFETDYFEPTGPGIEHPNLGRN